MALTIDRLKHSHFTLKKETMWRKKTKSFTRRTEEKTPILENNNALLDGYEIDNVHENPSVQNSLNIQQEQHSQNKGPIELRDLATVLDVAPDAVPEKPDASADGSYGETPRADKLQKDSVRLIQASVYKHFPKLPVEAEVNLEKHLLNVQETVAKELLRLAPLLKTSRLLGFLIDCYHRQTFAHLHGLLRHVTSTKKGFVLMEWALNTYLSQELLGHPDLQDKDLMKPVDLLLLTDWVQQAQDKLLLNMQVDISRSLEKILQNEKNEKSTTEDEEAFVRLHVDTIQCINANLQTAEHISPVLKERVREVCFQELQDFVKRYISMQKKTLEKQAKMDRPETTHFFKTLNTCKELKLYVQTNGKGIKNVDHVETVTALENMEAFTVKLLMDNLIQITESYLKRYFKKDDKQMLLLIDEIREQFHRRPCCLDVQKRVMDEAYQRISQIYFEHLVRSSQKKLEARWSDAAGRRVSQDAELLHLTFSDLSPEVRRWNLVLLTVRELLDCRSTDALKMTVAKMLQDCSKESCSVDLELLPALLRFRGDLSGWEVREVLDACLPDQPRPASCCCWS